MINFLAQRPIPVGNLRGIGNLGLQTGAPSKASDLFNTFISSAIGLLTIVAAIWFTFIFITGAYGIMSSGGEKGAYENAQKKISTGLTGLIVVIAATFIIDLVGWLLGFDLILNPANLLLKIAI